MTRDDIIRIAREADLPVAWISEKGVLRWSELERFAALVAPPRREWVGLTEEEVDRVVIPLGFAQLSPREVARAIEAALKEKNK
jgi:hypothetical protein